MEELHTENTVVENVETTDTPDTVTFEDLGLDEYTLKAVEKKGFVTPSPIQVLAIPRLLTGDTNLIARARTGTGKTAAFGLPIIQNVRGKSDHVEALILEPTRELAVQTCTEMQSFATEAYPRTTVLYGGASYANQIKDLKRGCEVVVGTPGRIKDHIERKTLDLSKIKYFILDEGDEMLDMGFIDDIEEIFRHANPDCRILLFSATMPAPILKIAGDFMGEYDIIEEEKVIDEALLIDQKYWVVKESEKIEALVRLIDISPDFYGLVFTMTKSDADRVTRELDLRGYEAAALHGDIMQNQREKVLERFRMKKTRILVATDVAARGIDVDDLAMVINYDLPVEAENYVHRIGRTARAGKSGKAYTFCSEQDVYNLPAIERYIEMSIPATVAYPDQMEEDKSAGMYIKTENWRGDDDYDNRGGYRKGRDGDIHNRRRDDRDDRHGRGGHGKYDKKGDGYKKDGYKKDGYKKGGKGRDEKRERKPYIDPAKLAGLSYEERMKMYKEAYASGSVSKGAKDIYKNGGNKKNANKKSSYKKGDYKKNGKKTYNQPKAQAQKAPEKKTFWQKVKSFFGR